MCRWQAVFVKKTSNLGIVTEDEPTGVRDLSVCEALKVTWKSWLLRLLQIYSATLLLPQTPTSAMPRSFLVKTKRTHLYSPPRDDYFRQQAETDAKEATTGHLEDAPKPLSPRIRDLLADPCSPKEGLENCSYRTAKHKLWPSGIINYSRNMVMIFFALTHIKWRSVIESEKGNSPTAALVFSMPMSKWLSSNASNSWRHLSLQLLLTVFFYSFLFLTKASVEKEVYPPPASSWSSDQQQSNRERELERLVLLLLNHTSHTDLKSPVRDCPLCEKVRIIRSWQNKEYSIIR